MHRIRRTVTMTRPIQFAATRQRTHTLQLTSHTITVDTDIMDTFATVLQ